MQKKIKPWDEIINRYTEKTYIVTYTTFDYKQKIRIYHLLDTSNFKTSIINQSHIHKFDRTGRIFTIPKPILFRDDGKGVKHD